MQFAFFLGNHNELGQRSLEDVVGICGHQLRALGHQAVWEQAHTRVLCGGEGVNVIVEGFTRGENGSIRMLANTRQQGARWLCIATEEPTPRGFNWGKSREMVMRQETFAEAAPYLSGILHLVPGEQVTRWYDQFAPTAQAELGFAKTLVRPKDHMAPKFEFGFYGSLSSRRYRILKRLAKRANVENAIRIVADFTSQEERDRIMREAKVIVQIRKFDEMGLVSSSRCCTALCVGRPVVAESHDVKLSKPWDEIVKFTEPLDGEERRRLHSKEAIFEAECDRFCMNALAVRATWRAVHEGQFIKLMEKLSPEHCWGEPLRKIGILEDKAVAA